jgi:hypothetical protein
MTHPHERICTMNEHRAENPGCLNYGIRVTTKDITDSSLPTWVPRRHHRLENRSFSADSRLVGSGGVSNLRPRCVIELEIFGEYTSSLTTLDFKWAIQLANDILETVRRTEESYSAASTIDANGDRIIKLYSFDGEAGFCLVADHILEVLVGPRPTGHVAGFLDGDRGNCALENLEWIPG